MALKKNFRYKKSGFHVISLPHKNILYFRITERPQTFNMVASGVQITFDLASNLRGLKLLQTFNATQF